MVSFKDKIKSLAHCGGLTDCHCEVSHGAVTDGCKSRSFRDSTVENTLNDMNKRIWFKSQMILQSDASPLKLIKAS